MSNGILQSRPRLLSIFQNMDRYEWAALDTAVSYAVFQDAMKYVEELETEVKRLEVVASWSNEQICY